jgi:RimJ/RimL family protein N-acetyltransferase
VTTRIETERLVIRTFAPADAEAWVAMVNDAEVKRFLPPGPEATTQTFHETLERRLAMEDDVGHAMWAVDDKVTGTFVGQCGIRPVDEGAGPEIDLAYHFTRASWNKGYGTEATIAVLAHGLGPVGLQRIMAVAMPQNVGSWRIMEKAGMRYEALVNYYGLEGLKKYVADRDWWRPPLTAQG